MDGFFVDRRGYEGVGNTTEARLDPSFNPGECRLTIASAYSPSRKSATRWLEHVHKQSCARLPTLRIPVHEIIESDLR
jgi:hypothetical protein